jgi:hypothetical protein
MKQVIFSLVILFSLSLLLFGCGGKSDQVEIAKKFWSALEAQDLETARRYATTETAQSLTINEDQQNREIDIAFGEVSQEDGKSLVATTITTSNEGIEMDIPLQTVMVKEGGEWKVDVNQTMMSMFGGAMGAMMEGLTESMKDGMEEMGKAMTDQMNSSMEKLEDPQSR